MKDASAPRLQVYTGEGKGKTTAAMGLALRAVGHGWPTLICQFMKDGRSGELAALAALDRVRMLSAPPMPGFVSALTPCARAEAARQQTAFAAEAAQAARAIRPRLIVLDELAVALSLGMVPRVDAEALLGACLVCGETVVTGRNAPDWLLAQADYVSRIEALRHPYADEGLPAREGIEW